MIVKKEAWWHYLVPPTVLSAITTLFYYPSLHYPFLFDDLPNITKNYEIRQLNPRGLFFANSRWISRLLNQFTYHNWEFSPFVYRFMNLLIHLSIGLLIFTTVLLLCKQAKKHRFLQENHLLFATITSALFLLHPVQTQTVTYVTQLRLEGLVTLFSFAIILTFTLAATTKLVWLKALLYAFCAVLTSFSAGTKEIIVVLPILLALTDWFFIAQGDIKVFAKRFPVHLLLTFILYKTYLYLGSPVAPALAFQLKITMPNNRGNILTQTPQELITPLKYLTSQFKVMLHYLTMFFWPLNLSFDYGWKIPPSFWSPSCLYPFLTLVTIWISGLILFIKNRINIVTFSIAWFFAAVVPRSSIIPSTELVCDYKTYLASFGVLFFIAYVLTHVILFTKTLFANLQIDSPQIAHIALPALLCVGLGFGTQQRNIVWSSRTEFWGDVIHKTEPHTSARAYNNYAVGLVNIGKPIEAIAYYKKAIKTDLTYAEPVINLALHYQMRKEHDKAFALYQKAIKMREVHPEMYNNLGLLHLTKGSHEKAIRSFQTAIRFRRHYSRAHFGLGQVYQRQNKHELALACYEQAINGDQPTLQFYYTHGSLSFSLKKYAKVVKSLEFVDRTQKNYKKTRFLLASSYYYLHQYKKSIPYYDALYRKKPGDPLRCYNYGQALLHTKNYSKALEVFLKCKKFEKRLPHVPLHIAKCLYHLGETNKAKEKLAQFIKTAQAPTLKKMGTELLQEFG